MKDLVNRRRLATGAVDADSDERPPPRAPHRPRGVAGSRINPTVSAAAVTEAQNALASAHTSGDYRYESIGDLIRAALRAYGDGLLLTQQPRNGRKKRHTVELPAELFERYEGLPRRSRGVIIERALLSFLAQGFARPEGLSRRSENSRPGEATS